MDTTGSPLHHFARRLGARGTSGLLLALAGAAILFVMAVLALEAAAMTSESVLMAPFRW